MLQLKIKRILFQEKLKAHFLAIQFSMNLGILGVNTVRYLSSMSMEILGVSFLVIPPLIPLHSHPSMIIKEGKLVGYISTNKTIPNSISPSLLKVLCKEYFQLLKPIHLIPLIRITCINPSHKYTLALYFITECFLKQEFKLGIFDRASLHCQKIILSSASARALWLFSPSLFFSIKAS